MGDVADVGGFEGVDDLPAQVELGVKESTGVSGCAVCPSTMTASRDCVQSLDAGAGVVTASSGGLRP